MRPSLLIIDPAAEDCTRDLDEVESLHLAELAGYLQAQNIAVSTINARLHRLSVMEVATLIEQSQPLCICIWLQYRSISYSLALLDEVASHSGPRRPLVVLEGIAATLSANTLLSQIQAGKLDAVILGESEATLAELVSALAADMDWHSINGLSYLDEGKSIHYTAPREQIADLDSLPFAHRQATSYTPDQWVELRGSRGCNYHCAFCNIRPYMVANAGAAWRGRSPGNIYAEIVQLCGQGARRFFFVDENAFGSGKAGSERMRVLAECIIRGRHEIEWQFFCRADQVDPALFEILRRSGLSIVNLGLEAGKQSQLDRFEKELLVTTCRSAARMLQGLGITLIPSFIMFDPWVGLSEIRATLTLLVELDQVGYVSPNTMIAFPGVSMTEQMRKEGLLDHDHPLVPGYIAGMYFKDLSVQRLYDAWVDWQAWANEQTQGRFRQIANAAYRYQLARQYSSPALQQSFTDLKLLKLVEIRYVMSTIQSLEEGEPIPSVSMSGPDLSFQDTSFGALCFPIL